MTRPARTYRFGSQHRDSLWLREQITAYLDGRGKLPICNLCSQPVADTDWHESHDPGRARSLGGKATGIAHAACNLQHGRSVVVPALAKAKRVAARHQGLKGPGLGPRPMRAGRRSRESKTFSHGIVRRLTGSQKHARMMAKRFGADTQEPDHAR